MNFCSSFSPNPYTASLTIGVPAGTPITFQNPQSFQIISSGLDGLYGVGGQFVSNLQSSATVPLPFDAVNTFSGSTMGKTLGADTDANIRVRESDNLTNFKAGSLN